MTKFFIGAKLWPGISKLIEEAGEVAQVCGKLLGTNGELNHWDGSNLKDRLEEELGDLMAAIHFVIEENGLNYVEIEKRRLEKQNLFLTWHENELAKQKAQDESTTSSD